MSLVSHICEYCNKSFSTKGNLIAHQKSAKYCIQRQGIDGVVYTCEYCHKDLTNKYRLVDHLYICKVKKELDEKTQHQQTELYYTEKLQEVKEQSEKTIQMVKEQSEKTVQMVKEQSEKTISELKLQIQELQNKLYELASRPQVVSNSNSNNISNKVMNLQMITPEHLQEQAKHLTLDHIKRGAVGYGEYFLEHPLKDRVVCTDFSRRKIKYKNENGEIVTDPELTILSEALFKSIRDRNRELAMQYTKEITDRFANKNDPAEVSYFMELATKFSEQDVAVGKMLDGVRNEMFHDIIRHICSKTMAA
jgi:hypothetical protein